MRAARLIRAAYFAGLPALILTGYLVRAPAAADSLPRAETKPHAESQRLPVKAPEPPAPPTPTELAAPESAKPAGDTNLGVVPLPALPARAAGSFSAPSGPSRIEIEPASAAELRAMTWLLPEPVMLGIDKQRETRFAFDEASRTWLLQHPEAVLSGIRFEWVDGAILLSDVRADSLADRMGLQAGDRITALDGAPPGNPDQVSTALGRSHELGALVVDVERAGEPWQLTLIASAAESPRTPRLQR